MYLREFLALEPFLDYSLCSVCILPQPAFCSQSAVCILPLVRSLQSAVCSLRFTLTGCSKVVSREFTCNIILVYELDKLHSFRF